MAESADKFASTRPVPPQFDFDRSRLTDFLAARIPGFAGPIAVEQFKGGQSNPTFLVRAGERRYVMRRKPPGKLLPSAHAVDREYRVLTALAGTEVPVPRTHVLCEDDSVIGTAFYVMDFVPGRIFWDPSLPGLEPAERRAIYDDMNRVIAALHQVDFRAVGLGDYGRTGQYVERQVARWSSQYKAAETQHIEAMEQLIAWLPQNIPPADETSIVHGDYRLDNLIFHPTEPRILAVLDWELSTLGHPLVDFAYHCMKWRLPPGVFRTLHGIDLVSAGIPSEQEYVAAYCRRTGRPEIPREQWEFYIVFSMFRLAGIVQGIAKRAQQGNASSAEAVAMGALARPLAEEGWACVERLGGAR
jgi:aminoglycoside phosphotransferase (APT) family kinase protein